MCHLPEITKLKIPQHTYTLYSVQWQRWKDDKLRKMTYSSFSSPELLSSSSRHFCFQFLYLSINSTRYEFFFAVRIHLCFKSSFAVGLCGQINAWDKLSGTRCTFYMFKNDKSFLKKSTHLWPPCHYYFFFLFCFARFVIYLALKMEC